jgi:hypothetical protein
VVTYKLTKKIKELTVCVKEHSDPRVVLNNKNVSDVVMC